VTTSIPDWLEPMAATLTQDRFSGPEWSFERKFDGIRLLAFKHGADVRLLSRNRLPLNGSYPAVVQAIASLPVHDVILDGEAIGGWERFGSADYYVFDILWLDGRDVTSLPLEERRALLGGLSLRLPIEQVRELDEASPWERACAEGWEGVIAKRRSSTYEHRRSKSWLKMKCEETHPFVVGGFTDPQGKRVGLGALLVGYFAPRQASGRPEHESKGSGDDFCFAGKIGTGFDTALLLELRERLNALEIPKTPFTKAKGLPRLRAHWVRPEIVVNAGFIEWTGHGKLRHPRLLGVLNDMPASDVRLRQGSSETTSQPPLPGAAR
jgi:bifunctional non-homologous end joining protein LigD